VDKIPCVKLLLYTGIEITTVNESTSVAYLHIFFLLMETVYLLVYVKVKKTYVTKMNSYTSQHEHFALKYRMMMVC